MPTAAVACTNCGTPIADEAVLSGAWTVCLGCGHRLKATVFPAVGRPPEAGIAGATITEADEASCFYHESRRAVVSCNACGRFLCALCDVELNGEHLCPSCVGAGRKKGKLKNIENRRTRFDLVALRLPLLALLFFPTTLIAAPAALYIVIRYWKAPGSVVVRSKWRMIVAAIIAVIELAGWGLWFAYLAMK